jgi:hypothetical protein
MTAFESAMEDREECQVEIVETAAVDAEQEFDLVDMDSWRPGCLE